MARIVSGSQFYVQVHAFVYDRNEPYLPLPSQLKLVLTPDLPTPEGWKAELS